MFWVAVNGNETETHNNVVHIIFLDLGSEVDVDLNSVLGILLFDSMKQRMEPLCRSEVTDDPSEINLRSSIKTSNTKGKEKVPWRGG
jgi:hypothetical protein